MKLTAQTCPSLTSNSPTVSCTSPCTILSAAPTVTLNATTSYSVSSIAYSPYSLTTGTSVSTATDDIYTSSITIPFCFEFFGNTYTSLIIGSNGNVCFNISLAGALDPWSISGALPGSNCNATYNAIMSPWCDIYPPGGGTIKYATYGTAPCRAFVVSFNNLTMFLPGTYCTGIHETSQIVLYETTNNIDIYIGNHQGCTSWNSGRAVTGIENSAGTLFYTAPGENGTVFTATNQGWRFSPNGTAIPWSYTWTGPLGVIATTDTVTVCPLTTTTYTATATAITSCGTITTTSNSIVTSTVTPTFISGTNHVCEADYIALVGTPIGGTWSSSNASIAYVSGGNVTGISPGVATITYSLGGCYATQTVTVNPIYNTTSNLTICDGDTLTFGGNFYTSAGTYSHTFSTINGCDSVVILNLSIRPLPTLNFYIPNGICVGDTLTASLVSHSSGITDYFWNFGNAHIVTASSDHGGPYTLFYDTSGIYTISVYATDGFCNSRKMIDTIQVIKYPDARIAPYQNDVCFGDSILFRPLNIEYMNYYQWYPANYFYVFEAHLPYETSAYGIIDASGWATLTVTNPYGCSSSDSVWVSAHSCCSMTLPSAFTPNGDGNNDRFGPFGGHYHLLDFLIKNRFGETVFESVRMGDKWDGTLNGVAQDLGTYFYFVIYDCEGRLLMKKGDVTLIR